jgi:hypothetical protein
MRRLLLVAALAATLLVAAPATVGQAATGSDQVLGLGTLGQFGTPTAILGAVRGQRGSLGGFTITYPDGTYAVGTVTCLDVTANVAYLTGRIAWSGGPRKETNKWFPGSHLIIGVEDNGNGGAGETPDRMNFSPGLATDPGCGPNLVARPDFVIVRGNYRVVDGG